MQKILILFCQCIIYLNIVAFILWHQEVWNFYRGEINYSAIENNDDGNKTNNTKTITRKSFEYKTKIIGRTLDHDNT